MQHFEELLEKYARPDSGLKLLRLENRLQLCTKPAFSQAVERALAPVRKQTLTQAALETLCGILGIYAVTVTVHALYNLMVSSGGAGTALGYCLPAALIAAWKLWPAIRKSYGR